MTELQIPIKRLNSLALIPSYAHDGDAGVDLCSIEEVVLQPFGRALISTGISLAIPKGYGGFVLPRSGLAIKNGISLVNSPGLIDSNYRGEIKLIAINLDPNNSFTVQVGDRIAQLVIMRVEEIDFLEHDQLDDTQRGSGGFGSSGIKSSQD